MSIKIYKDDSANAIFIEDANGAQFLNSLQATIDGSSLVHISDTAKDIEIVSNVAHTEFVDESYSQYPGDATAVCNALNAMFQSSGAPSDELPNITSATSINVTQGDTINYELTADYGVGYEWSSLPSGLTTVEGNIRKLVGGSSLTAGTYNVGMKAINYNGEDSETLAINVASPTFSDTKSINFNNSDYLGGNAALLDSVLGRAGNGSGSGDGWFTSFKFKPGTASNASQTIWYFGSQDVANGGYIQIKYNGSLGRLEMRYGSNNNRLTISTQSSSLSSGTWYHIGIGYDGGTTGSSSGSISDYYSRFKFFIDANEVTSGNVNANRNFGYTGSISGTNFRFGRWNSGQAMRNNCRLNEFAIWDSDQSSNWSDIYNSGVNHDLSLLTTPPDHWWRMGDNDTYPNIQDNGDTGGVTMIMYNMTSSDIVNDV